MKWFFFDKGNLFNCPFRSQEMPLSTVLHVLGKLSRVHFSRLRISEVSSSVAGEFPC